MPKSGVMGYEVCLFLVFWGISILISIVVVHQQCRRVPLPTHHTCTGDTGVELRDSHLLGRWYTTWSTLPALICVGYFWDRVSQTIFLGWLRTMVLLITASRVVRIKGASHQHLADCFVFFLLLQHSIHCLNQCLSYFC
jgi:hypothetical protein